jgi:sugar lactone lactonase YvrE
VADGEPAEADFWEPGGMALGEDGASAWVADTNNHALRRVELATGRVRSVAVEPAG